jgi:hypothetical protein
VEEGKIMKTLLAGVSDSKLPGSRTLAACVAAGGLMMAISTAQAAVVTWDFNLPGSANDSLNPPYVSVATLTLEDTATGVVFTLDPNEDNLRYDQGEPSNSTVDALNITYSGPNDLAATNYVHISGATANAGTFACQGSGCTPFVAVVPPPASAVNMDDGYTSTAGQLKLTWNNPDFPVGIVSSWRITGTTIADNFSFLASGNNKPSPTFGIFSVSPLSQCEGCPLPNPSNWVTGSSPVPLPAAAWLFGSVLFGFLGLSKRKRA